MCGSRLYLYKKKSMEQLKKNKEFIAEYFSSLSGTTKKPSMLSKYVSDPELSQHIEFFEAVFPLYEIYADEMTAEGNRVVVRARFRGKHEGDFNGIPPTHKHVEFSFAIGYEIENGKITHHWLLADQMSLMEQLGVAEAAAV
jgi:predicted ester cyclase